MFRVILTVFFLVVSSTKPALAHTFEDGTIHPHEATESSSEVGKSADIVAGNQSATAERIVDGAENKDKLGMSLECLPDLVSRTVEEALTKLGRVLGKEKS